MSDDYLTFTEAKNLMNQLAQDLANDNSRDLIKIFNEYSIPLENFYNNFVILRNKINDIYNEKTGVSIGQYFSKKHAGTIEKLKQTHTEIILNAYYNNLLEQMKIGYYFLNKIRDLIFGELKYHIAYQEGQITRQMTLTLEQLLEVVTLSLSNRVDLSAANIARLEADIKKYIRNNKNNIEELNEDNWLKLQNRLGHSHSGKNKNPPPKYKYYAIEYGNLWEVYEYYLYVKDKHLASHPENIIINNRVFHGVYELARRGNLPYYKGGDVGLVQNKFGVTFALTSTAALDNLEKVITMMKSDNLEIIKDNMKKIFVQDESKTIYNVANTTIKDDLNKLNSFMEKFQKK